MKPLFFALCVVFAFGSLCAQTFTWQPSPGHTQVQIWPGPAPDPQPVAGPEVSKSSGGMIHVRAGVGRTNRQEELNDTTLGYPSLLTSVFVIRKELETLRLL